MRSREDPHAAPLIARADRQDPEPLCDPAHPRSIARVLLVMQRRPVQLGGSYVPTLIHRQISRNDPLPRPRPGIPRIQQARGLSE
jgi:hypothetical protein